MEEAWLSYDGLDLAGFGEEVQRCGGTQNRLVWDSQHLILHFASIIWRDAHTWPSLLMTKVAAHPIETMLSSIDQSAFSVFEIDANHHGASASFTANHRRDK